VSDIDTIPSSVEMTTFGPEIVPWTTSIADAVADAGGSGASSPSSSMVDGTTGLPVLLADSPSVVGLSITQTVRASALTAKHTYDVYVSYTVTGAPSTTVLTFHFTINVPA